MARSIPDELEVNFTSDWAESFDGRELSRAALTAAGYRLFPWQIESTNPWWSRPLKYGEIGCTLAHLACWRDAAQNGNEPWVLVVEDDADLPTTFLDDVQGRLQRLTQPCDLLYLGRYPLEQDLPVAPGFVSPGYSHCTYAYLLARRALD